MALPNPAMSFSPFAILTAEEMNNLVENDQALADGSGFNTGAIPASALQASANPQTIADESTIDFVASGLILTGNSYGSTLLASLSSGVVYINGIRIPISAVANRAYTASRDTYVDVGLDGVVDFNPVTNNSASPALSAGHIRIGIVITGASNIASAASINQGQLDRVLPISGGVPYTFTDSLGNVICNRDPQGQMIGYRQIISNYGNASAVQVPGLDVPFIADGIRNVNIKFQAAAYTSSSAAGSGQAVQIREGATALALGAYVNAGGNFQQQVVPERVLTPSAGLHTYNIYLSPGAGTLTINASTANPAYVKIERT